MRFALILAVFVSAASISNATTITDTLPFALNSPSSQSEALPQFDPALGTLTDATVTFSGTLQQLIQISDTGPGFFNVSIQDFINLGTLQARSSLPVGGVIPKNTPVDAFQLPPTPFGASTSLQGQLAQFTGTGTVPFVLTLPNPEITFQGATVTSVFSSYFAQGAITLNYTYTAPAAVPEPSTAVFMLCGALSCMILAPASRRRLVHGLSRVRAASRSWR